VGGIDMRSFVIIIGIACLLFGLWGVAGVTIKYLNDTQFYIIYPWQLEELVYTSTPNIIALIVGIAICFHKKYALSNIILKIVDNKNIMIKYHIVFFICIWLCTYINLTYGYYMGPVAYGVVSGQGRVGFFDLCCLAQHLTPPLPLGSYIVGLVITLWEALALYAIFAVPLEFIRRACSRVLKGLALAKNKESL
jgi:hypothetical protein